jgi:hypothetical protein
MKKTDGRKYLPSLPDWEYATWTGAEYLTLAMSAGMTFRERLEWLENISELLRIAGSLPDGHAPRR